jgi:hypothetical protein
VPSAANDPLSEAEVFIAYGRHAQAEALLKRAISKAPARADLQQALNALQQLPRSKTIQGSRFIYAIPALFFLAIIALVLLRFVL